MGLETFTGKVSDLVETNPPGTDPKSQGDDHLRGIKKTIIGQAINAQVGQHTTAGQNHFLDGSIADQMTLKRGTVDAPGAEILKVLEGVLSFPNQGQLLAPNGYVKLPGGLIIQWGNGTAVGGGIAQAPFPTPFPNSCLQMAANSISSNIVMAVSTFDATEYTIYANLGSTGAGTDTSFRWIAVGY